MCLHCLFRQQILTAALAVKKQMTSSLKCRSFVCRPGSTHASSFCPRIRLHDAAFLLIYNSSDKLFQCLRVRSVCNSLYTAKVGLKESFFKIGQTCFFTLQYVTSNLSLEQGPFGCSVPFTTQYSVTKKAGLTYLLVQRAASHRLRTGASLELPLATF